MCWVRLTACNSTHNRDLALALEQIGNNSHKMNVYGGLATAAIRAALTAAAATVAASTITCSDQIERKKRDNEVSHRARATYQTKQTLPLECLPASVDEKIIETFSARAHFISFTADLSFKFEFHMLSIVFAAADM